MCFGPRALGFEEVEHLGVGKAAIDPHLQLRLRKR